MKTFRSRVPGYVDADPIFIKYDTIDELLTHNFFDNRRIHGGIFYVNSIGDLLMCRYENGERFVVGYLNSKV